jgi:hypothetical protein
MGRRDAASDAINRPFSDGAGLETHCAHAAADVT